LLELAGSEWVEQCSASTDVSRIDLEQRGPGRGAAALSQWQQLPSVRRWGWDTAQQARTRPL